jgi:type II secretory pathway pseudopilin PulG
VSTSRGITVLEALVGLVVVALMATAVAPALARMRASALTGAGARYLAVTLHSLRWQSVAGRRAHGLCFVRDNEGWAWTAVRDGNGNGLSSAEIASGIDPTLSGPHRLEHAASGVTLGFPPGGPFPRIPPATGWIDDLDDPVRFGATDVVSFGALGTSSSGTLYLTDARERLYAIVLYGPTARVRVWRYDAASTRWTS